MTQPGRDFDLSKQFEDNGINFNSSTQGIFECLINNIGSEITNDYIYYQGPNINGLRHWFTVAILSKYVAFRMLENKTTKGIIDNDIRSLSPEGQEFLKNDNYANYLKLVELLGLFHDTGRPADGIDQWDEESAENVSKNIGYLLSTTDLNQDDQNKILELLKHSILDGKSPAPSKHKNNAFLFAGPFGLGDSLDIVGFKSSWQPAQYIRAYQGQYGFRNDLEKIVNEAKVVMPHSRGSSVVGKYKHSTKGLKKDFISMMEEDYKQFINPQPGISQEDLKEDVAPEIRLQISDNLRRLYRSCNSAEDFAEELLNLIVKHDCGIDFQSSFNEYKAMKDKLNWFEWVLNAIKEFFGYGLALKFASDLEIKVQGAAPQVMSL